MSMSIAHAFFLFAAVTTKFISKQFFFQNEFNGTCGETKRGTDSAIQLLLESEETAFNDKTQWPIGGKVSKYFGDGFLDLWNGGLKDDFTQLTNQYTGFTLLVTGHSLGGALASVAASYIVGVGLYDAKMVQLITIGQPRTGDVDYAAAVDAKIEYTFRIVHAQDLVPHLPMNGFETYHHHKNEIWYNNKMAIGDPYIECDEDDSIKCSDSTMDLSVAEHLTYFDFDYHRGCPYPS